MNKEKHFIGIDWGYEPSRSWKLRNWLANILEKIVSWLRGEKNLHDDFVDAMRYGMSIKQVKPKDFYKKVK